MIFSIFKKLWLKSKYRKKFTHLLCFEFKTFEDIRYNSNKFSRTNTKPICS